MERTASGKGGMSNFEILVDSDALIGLALSADAHHTHSCQIFSNLFEQKKRLVVTSAVVAEVATVLSHYEGQEVARNFLKNIAQDSLFPLIFIDEKIYTETIDLFSLQNRRGTSFTDCANVVVMKHYDIPAILSFDKVYSRDFHLEIVR